MNFQQGSTVSKRKLLGEALDTVGVAIVAAVAIMFAAPVLHLGNPAFWYCFLICLGGNAFGKLFGAWSAKRTERKRKREAMPTHDDI